MSHKNNGEVNGLNNSVRSTSRVLSFFNKSKRIIIDNEVKNDSAILECDPELNVINKNERSCVESNNKL